MPIVFDSNIYVSAFVFGGRPLELVAMGLDGLLDIVVSQSIIDETLRVLREKFHVKPPELDRAFGIMTASARIVKVGMDVKAVPDDPNDDHVVSCAMTAGANAIITGDKDLLRLQAYEGIRMMTVSAFLEHQLKR